MPIAPRAPRINPLALIVLTGAPGATAQPTVDLGRFFGFDTPRVLVADVGVGPVITADIDGDGRADVIAVNNRKSRIELHLQRPTPLSEDEVVKAQKVNEFPPSRYYDRKEISVAHQVTAVQAFDVNADGKLDLVYAGRPEEIVVLKQGENLAFEIAHRKREKGLSATRSSFAIADVTGDARPEVLAAVNGRINIYPLSSSGALGEPAMLGAGGANEAIVAFFIEDYDGDGRMDVLGVIPDDAAPLRLWRQEKAVGGQGKNGALGAELRFEMPGLREVEPVRFPGRQAASIGVIERASRRIVFYDLAEEQVDGTPASPGSEREVQAEVRSFSDGAASDGRSVAIADVDGDGDLDLLATSPGSNQLILFRQQPGVGLFTGETFSSFRKPKAVAIGAWDAGDAARVFTLSEEEKTVGVSSVDAATGRITFPDPVQLVTAGSTPVAMSHVTLADGPALAVVVKDKRDHTIEIHYPGDGAVKNYAVPLEGVKRPPQSILAADIDHDGGPELLLLTPGEPMVVVRPKAAGAEAKVLTDKTMPQFGLVQAAGPDNTAILDVDGDGRSELLIADRNFVRAVEFKDDTGWRVVDQVTASNPATTFNSLAVVRDGSDQAILAYDKTTGRIARMAREFGGWRVVDTMRVPGFSASSIYAGAFTGDSRPGLLAVGTDGFGVVRFAGERASLKAFAAFRSDAENRLEHELTAGDLNGDGFTDVVVLDAREQMAQILTFSATRKVFLATEFEVFQSRLFTRGEGREFEPSDAIIDDVTGDRADDLVLVVHNRVIVYPQMTGAR